YKRKERKFFKKRPRLIDKYGLVLEKLKTNPFDPSLKTYKLKGDLSEFYACSLTYEYRIICVFLVQNETIVLVDIGSHNEVY
ncbi:MAG: type II toxin-antitoxin system mRNA interferase toxin, RelE/StbE family, partial [Pseudanabaena sp. M109S1SP2A07QC]|nr:type II toxin-antitoxin system mRNA interferase toxin, RelE/StbE family [Pseudanabaena sp. M109S1SP2A07QC]